MAVKRRDDSSDILSTQWPELADSVSLVYALTAVIRPVLRKLPDRPLSAASMKWCSGPGAAVRAGCLADCSRLTAGLRFDVVNDSFCRKQTLKVRMHLFPLHFPNRPFDVWLLKLHVDGCFGMSRNGAADPKQKFEMKNSANS